jgi:hypothetical protein
MEKNLILPPDPEDMNDARAEWAGEVLQHFQCRTGTDFEDALPDLLCDFMHWADRHGIDFDLTLDRARYHYRCETVGEIEANR